MGPPDLGLADLSEMAVRYAQIVSGVNVALIARGEAGFGRERNTDRTVRALDAKQRLPPMVLAGFGFYPCNRIGKPYFLKLSIRSGQNFCTLSTARRVT